jgi:hypothetical protein
MQLAVAFPQSGDLHPLSPSWNLEVLIFGEGGKTGEPGEKPLKQGREPTNKYTHN